jgi:hypothetical protein
VTETLAAAVGLACTDLPWYRQRIETFWAIEGAGYDAWRAACLLPERKA